MYEKAAPKSSYKNNFFFYQPLYHILNRIQRSEVPKRAVLCIYTSYNTLNQILIELETANHIVIAYIQKPYPPHVLKPINNFNNLYTDIRSTTCCLEVL